MIRSEISDERLLLRMAYVAGKVLYGSELEWGSRQVTIRKVSDRIKESMDQGTANACVMDTDTYEYGFGIDGSGGIDCADGSLFDEGICIEGYICLYHPEYGVDVLRVDVTQEEAVGLMRGYDDGEWV